MCLYILWHRFLKKEKSSWQKIKITRINVGGQATGIIGLESILEEVAEEFIGRTDDEIKAELLNRLS